MCPTKVLLPPGELLSYAHDPVELRRLNFQTPGRSTSAQLFLFCRMSALCVCDCAESAVKPQSILVFVTLTVGHCFNTVIEKTVVYHLAEVLFSVL